MTCSEVFMFLDIWIVVALMHCGAVVQWLTSSRRITGSIPAHLTIISVKRLCCFLLKNDGSVGEI